MFVVGTSKGMMLLKLPGNGVSGLHDQRECSEKASETLAVDFWTPDLVLGGTRSGQVRIWDIRSKGTNVRFQHPSCISNIKALNHNQVLVAGLKDRMAIYDTRFTKGYLQSQRSHKIEQSIPLQVFPSYRQGSHIYPRLGFDVHLRMGLIASATEDEGLQIFNWKSSKQELDVGAKEITRISVPNHTPVAVSAEATAFSSNSPIPPLRRLHSMSSSAANAHINAPNVDTPDAAHVVSHDHTSRSFRSNATSFGEPPSNTTDGQIRCVKFVENQQSADGLRLLVANGTKIDAWAW
ncbi:MAG: hypothetical protein Q9209_001354 [Squamulea sp. 1 TL-2023]